MSEIFIFRAPVLITTGGKEQQVEEIELQAPAGNIQNLFARLEAEYSKLQKIFADEAQAQVGAMSPEAIAAGVKALQEVEAAKDDDTEDVEDIDAQVAAFLQQVKSAGFNLTTSYTILKEILTKKNSGCNAITNDGSFKLESGHWDKLPMKEIKRLLGFYIINFIDGSD